jgi:prepilin-type N-terminal cleavage/methylation domain-containing protein
MRSNRAFSLLELLIVLAIIGVVAGLGFLNGRRIAERQSAQGALATIQQSIWQGATAAAARGATVELVRAGNDFTLQLLRPGVDPEVLRTFEIPDDAITNLGGEGGLILRFLPPGKVDLDTLRDLPETITFQTDSSSYVLRVSMIGEVIAEALP